MTILAIVYGKAKRCLKENLVDFARGCVCGAGGEDG